MRLQRRVAFDHCRHKMGWPSSIDKMAAKLEGCYDPNSSVQDVSSAWRAHARGDSDPVISRQQLMEIAAPGTHWIRHHEFWPFLGSDKISDEKLMQTAWLLPQEKLSGFLTTRSHVQLEIDDEDYLAVISHGNLDQIAALFAIAELIRRDSDHPGKAEEIDKALYYAARLLVRISLDPPYRQYVAQIWRFLEKTYPHNFDGKHIVQWDLTMGDYEILLKVSEAFGVVPSSGLERRWLLSIADRKHFERIMDRARFTSTRLDELVEIGLDSLDPELLLLFETYREVFELPKGDAWFADPPYPRERLELLDESIRNCQ